MYERTFLVYEVFYVLCFIVRECHFATALMFKGIGKKEHRTKGGIKRWKKKKTWNNHVEKKKKNEIVKKGIRAVQKLILFDSCPPLMKKKLFEKKKAEKEKNAINLKMWWCAHHQEVPEGDPFATCLTQKWPCWWYHMAPDWKMSLSISYIRLCTGILRL